MGLVRLEFEVFGGVGLGSMVRHYHKQKPFPLLQDSLHRPAKGQVRLEFEFIALDGGIRSVQEYLARSDPFLWGRETKLLSKFKKFFICIVCLVSEGFSVPVYCMVGWRV